MSNFHSINSINGNKKRKCLLNISNKQDIFQQECGYEQVFDTISIEKLLDWQINITNNNIDTKLELRSFEELFKGFNLFSDSKIKTVKARMLCYEKKIATYEDLIKISKKTRDKICLYFPLPNPDNQNTYSKEEIKKIINDKLRKELYGKVNILKNTIIYYGNDILLKSLERVFKIINYNIDKYKFLDKTEINNIIFYHYNKLLQLYKDILGVFNARLIKAKSEAGKESYKGYIQDIKSVIDRYIKECENIRQFKKEYYLTKKEEVFNEMKEAIGDKLLSNTILDYWEILSEYLKYTVALRNAILIKQRKNNELLSFIKIALINEYINENFLVNGASVVEDRGIKRDKSIIKQDFSFEKDLLQSSTNFVYTLLLVFGGQKILGTASDIALALRPDNGIVGEYFVFFYPYLSRFLKYNILNMFKLTKEQYHIVSNIYNYYNIFNSKDSGIVYIKNKVNYTLSYLIERRNKSKLSSLIHNNFTFFRKIRFKIENKYGNITFSDILLDELDLDIENILEEMSVDITGDKDNNSILSYILLDDNSDGILSILNIYKNIINKLIDLLNKINKEFKLVDKEYIEHRDLLNEKIRKQIIEKLYDVDGNIFGNILSTKYITLLQSIVSDIDLYIYKTGNIELLGIDEEEYKELQEYIMFDKDYITFLVRIISKLDLNLITGNLYKIITKYVERQKDENDIISYVELEEIIFKYVSKLFNL